MGTIKRDEDGLYFESNNGIEYSLLEGHSIGANSTSDILFVMFDRYTEYPVEMVMFMYGADTLEGEDEDEDKQYTIKTIEEAVNKFEEKFTEIPERSEDDV